MNRSTLFATFALLLVLPLARSRGQGNNNPTGPSGDFNGQINTGCSYEPYTGNVKRVVHDLTLAGAVGAYPLNWTRFANSRHSLSSSSVVLGQGAYWSHSYYWTIDLSMNIGYPDGRLIPFGDQSEQQPGDILRGPAGVSDRLLVVTAPEGNSLGEYDLLLSDGGRVCFRRVGVAPLYTTRIAKIIDPYGRETQLSYTTAGALDRITEPAGRYLQINYVTIPGQSFKCIGSVDANDGRGNITQSVSYTYVQASGFNQLTHADYSDGTHATYTYLTNRLLSTCDDVRYSGPMKKILYQYMPNGTVGQIKSEKNLTTGQVVSQIAYPSDLVRVETRGDGPTRTLTYNDQARLVSYTDFYTSTTQPHTSYIYYDGNGYKSAFQNARGHTTYTQREGNIGALIRLIHPDPDTTYQGYGYTDYDNPYYVNIRGDERGHNTYFSRDEHNRIYKISYPDWDPNHPDDSPAESVTYNELGQVSTHTMVSRGVETYIYDPRGLLQTYTPPATPSDPNPGAHPVQYFYYTSGAQTDRLLRIMDPRGNSTSFEYNGRGQITKVTHQDGSYVQADYNPDGTLAWVADENHPGAATDPNQRTRYVYDEYKRVVSVTNPMNETINVDYALDWVNPLIHTTSKPHYILSPNNKNVFFDYDPNFRKIDQAAAFSSADESWTLFEYDEVGNLTKLTDPRFKETTFGYDTRNRRIWLNGPIASDRNTNGHTIEWTYDGVGNTTKETRADNAFRSWDYDSINRLLHAIDWRMTTGEQAVTTTYDRDVTSTHEIITDPNGKHYRFVLDALGRKTTETYPADAANVERTEQWYYDAAGNLVQRENRAGQTQILSYDNRNRKTRSFWFYNVGPDIVTDYDAASRVTGLHDAEADIGFSYDDANRKTSETETIKSYGLYQTHSVTYEYDHDGNRSRLLYPHGYDYRYTYTNRNQLDNIRLAWVGSPTVQYTYDKTGNRAQRTLWNGGITQYAMDDANRVTALASYFANNGFARYDYGYDVDSRMKYEQRNWGLADGFNYDTRNELSGFHNNGTLNDDGTVNASYNCSFTYDNNGNRVDVNDGNDAPYTAADNNQYKTDWTGEIGYDDNANLTSRAGWIYTYDAQNRLTSIDNNGAGIHIHQHYDALNRIVARDSSGDVTTNVWDNWDLLEEHYSNDAIRRCYLHGAAVNEIVASFDGPSYGDAFYFEDGRGNVTHLTDDGNNVIEHYSYFVSGQPNIDDGYGNWRSNSVVDNRFLFKGALYAPQAVMYDMRNRFYHPNLGRFMQNDPIGFAGGDLNLFRYCGADPVNGSDPSGLVEIDSTSEPIIVNDTPLSSDYPFGTSPQDFERMFGPTLGGANGAGPDDITANILIGAGLATTHEGNIPIIPPEEESVAADDNSASQSQYDISGAISTLENNVPRYTAQFPQAPPAAPIVEALKQANAAGNIRVSASINFGGDAMRTSGGIINIKPNSTRVAQLLAVMLAHEGEHLVDTTPMNNRDNLVRRETNAYTVETLFSIVIPNYPVVKMPSQQQIMKRVDDRLKAATGNH